MIEAKLDLWLPDWDLKCITTNGFVKKDGSLVMGRGCAAQAQVKYKGIAKQLGNMVKTFGNHVLYLPIDGGLATFPVKHNWWEKADLELIERSAKELATMVNFELLHIRKVALPRPGCGNGRLLWKEVKPVIEKHLDNRFYVITK